MNRRFLGPLLSLALLLPAYGDAQGPPEGIQIQVFSDTASVRVELVLPAGGVAGELHGEIRALEGGAVLWEGELGTPASHPDGTLRLSRTITDLHPQLWSPEAPNRYALVVESGPGTRALRESVRFGFRRFEERGGQLFLNGRPIFLRGNAINPPDRSVPDSLSEQREFAADWVKYLKRINVNIIRLTRTSQVWLEVADSLGMMIYQGNYRTPPGGTQSRPPDKPFEEVIADYHDILGPLANHPSVVVYVLSNELASRDIIQVREGADTVAAYMRSVYRAMRQWDSTRVYIGNAGYGYGVSGDICDTHHYWGWYYNTVLSFYTLRDPHNCWRTERKQPLTISESVGSYTGPDGRFNIVSNSKQLSSQLNFTGHAPDTEQAERALAYQAFAARNAIEIVRRTRSINPHLAGIMPFTVLFSRWWDIGSFADMAPKPIAEQYAVSYQPVLLSWELWTPQVYAGTTLMPTAHVVNDDTLGRALSDVTLSWRLVDAAGAAHASGEVPISDVAYFDAVGTRYPIPLPPALAEGTYTLEGSLREAGREISHNRTSVFVAPRGYAGTTGTLARRIKLYDPPGATADAFRQLGIAFTSVSAVSGLDPGRDVLVLGAFAWDAALDRAAGELRSFVRAGGRVLALAQDPARFDTSWLGARVRLQDEEIDDPRDRRTGNPYRNAMAVNPERPDHPLFHQVSRDRMFLWSDPNGWTENAPGFPAVYPVKQGFVLENPDEDLGRVALLANYGSGLEGVGVAEIFDGDGSVLLSGLDLVGHVGFDPVADRLLVNAVRYEGSADPHHAHPLITAPITWGEYGSERGLVVGIYHGLIVNTVPVVPAGLEERFPHSLDEDGWHYAGGGGGWNSRPAITYAARGRRAFGPYELNLYSSPVLPAGHDSVGTGGFWCRVPAGTRRMVTTVENPAADPLTLEITLNGTTSETVIPAGQTVQVETPVSTLGVPLAVQYRADRRLVLLETAFAAESGSGS